MALMDTLRAAVPARTQNLTPRAANPVAAAAAYNPARPGAPAGVDPGLWGRVSGNPAMMQAALRYHTPMSQPGATPNPLLVALQRALFDRQAAWRNRMQAVGAFQAISPSSLASNAAYAPPAAAPAAAPMTPGYGYATANPNPVGTGPGQSPYAGLSAYQTPAAASVSPWGVISQVGSQSVRPGTFPWQYNA